MIKKIGAIHISGRAENEGYGRAENEGYSGRTSVLVEKAAVFFDKIVNLMFLLSFSVIRWNFGIFLVLFNGGVILLVEWT